VVRAAYGDCVDRGDAFGIIVSFDESLCHANFLGVKEQRKIFA